MARATGISATTVHRICAFGLQPHRVERSCRATLSHRQDARHRRPGLSRCPPDRALVLCDLPAARSRRSTRTQPMLPMRRAASGSGATRTGGPHAAGGCDHRMFAACGYEDADDCDAPARSILQSWPSGRRRAAAICVPSPRAVWRTRPRAEVARTAPWSIFMPLIPDATGGDRRWTSTTGCDPGLARPSSCRCSTPLTTPVLPAGAWIYHVERQAGGGSPACPEQDAVGRRAAPC